MLYEIKFYHWSFHVKTLNFNVQALVFLKIHNLIMRYAVATPIMEMCYEIMRYHLSVNVKTLNLNIPALVFLRIDELFMLWAIANLIMEMLYEIKSYHCLFHVKSLNINAVTVLSSLIQSRPFLIMTVVLATSDWTLSVLLTVFSVPLMQ